MVLSLLDVVSAPSAPASFGPITSISRQRSVSSSLRSTADGCIVRITRGAQTFNSAKRHDLRLRFKRGTWAVGPWRRSSLAGLAFELCFEPGPAGVYLAQLRRLMGRVGCRFRFRPTAMLSTRFGYLRPAARARARASRFCSGESRLLRFFGLVRFHGGRGSEREGIERSLAGGARRLRASKPSRTGSAHARRSVRSEPSCFTSLL
jgi:hypothetical protein